MLVSKRDALGRRESVGHADRVFDLQLENQHEDLLVFFCFFWFGIRGGSSDLSTIKVLSAKVIQLLGRELGSYAGCGDLVRLLDEGGPDLRLCFLTQLIVLDAEVYATLDRFVEDGHSVRGQYHHALKVLQLPQEDRNEGVVLQVVLGTSFEEDVCFVEQ